MNLRCENSPKPAALVAGCRFSDPEAPCIVGGMSIKPDWWIREKAKQGMIEPFEERLVREGVISYGLSSFGYDLRAAREWKIFCQRIPHHRRPQGPRPQELRGLRGRRGDHPAQLLRAGPQHGVHPHARQRHGHRHRQEHLCAGGHCGQHHPLEPGWEGHVTLEFSNTTPCRPRCTPAKGWYSWSSSRASAPR